MLILNLNYIFKGVKYKVVNVTKIIKIKKPKHEETTTTTTTTRANKKAKNKNANKLDELVFDSAPTTTVSVKPLELITTKYEKSKLIDAIDQVKTRIMEQTRAYATENDPVDQAINFEISDINNKLSSDYEDESTTSIIPTTTVELE